MMSTVTTLYSEQQGSIRVEAYHRDAFPLHDGRMFEARDGIEVRIYGSPTYGMKIEDAEALHAFLGKALEAVKAQADQPDSAASPEGAQNNE